MTQQLSSVHTSNFPQILRELGISVVVTTYQAGKLMVLRDQGGTLNTHFRIFQKPMGLVATAQRLSLGTAFQIWELRNIPDVAVKLHPAGQHDACFLPRQTYITGDIDIHEMAYAGHELWFVNTRFSCLCTLDQEHSFLPRWRPHFISAYDLSDRCHLNGLAVVDQQPKFVTALGETNTAAGWRQNKASGGILMDVPSNQILCRGLSMPHSPRWYRDQLWLLESGKGTLAKVDLQTGELTAIAYLPGFTRGLDFAGPLAFVGLSQVRETAVFSGLPITQRLTERICGVWVVNIETGEIIAFLRFEAGVQEIFAVQVLHGIRYPEIFGDLRFEDPEVDRLLSSSFVLPDDALQEIEITEAAPQSDPAIPPDPVNLPPEQMPAPVLQGLAVIIPVFNIQDQGMILFEQTLSSIQDSFAYLQEHYPYADQVTQEIVIVDDASTDGTWELLNQRFGVRPQIRLIRHDHNRGPAAARNTGARSSSAQVLFFCDADDLFLPSHLLTGWLCLQQPLPPANQATYRLPGNFPAAVKTSVKISEELHPYWLQQIKIVIPLNLCIRREAFEFLEGFPENQVFRESEYGLEDQAFSQGLTAFFSVIWHQSETVQYCRYPGNHLDQQIRRFRLPPGTYQEPIAPEEQQRIALIQQLTQTHLDALYKKFQSDFNIGNLLRRGTDAYHQDQWIEAEKLFLRILELDPSHLQARYNLGVVYSDLEQWVESTQSLTEVMEVLQANPEIQDPALADVYNQLGVVFSHQGLPEKAIPLHRQAISLRPHFALAHFNLGIALLTLGNFTEGFAEYEWRWQMPTFTPLKSPYPQWDGQPIPDKTLLIYTEQGAGDVIQFLRFIPLATQRCKRLIFCCTEALVNLVQETPGIDQIYTPGEIPLSEFQTQAPIMSLPHLLGITLETLPNQGPYLRIPMRISSKPWEAWKTLDPHRCRVGLVWAGSPTHRNDRNRSCPLQHLIPLLSIPEIEWISLQKGPQVKDLEQLPVHQRITNLDPYIQDYTDTAAAIQALDLVISVDTSVAHLAGALGKPVWIMLCYAPDWRWLQTRSDSPWYPTVRLFRQTRPKDWGSVVKSIHIALQDWQSTIP